jgi:hypothetical protein
MEACFWLPFVAMLVDFTVAMEVRVTGFSRRLAIKKESQHHALEFPLGFAENER